MAHFFLAVVEAQCKSAPQQRLLVLPAFTTAALACSPSLPTAFGLRAAVDDPLGHVGETSKPIRREATFVSYSPCEDCCGGPHGVRGDAHGVSALRS